MWMNAPRTTEAAVILPLVLTYLIASTVPAILDSPVTVLTAQVRQRHRLSVTNLLYYSHTIWYRPKPTSK